MQIGSREEVATKRAAEYDAYIEANYSSEQFSESEMCMNCIAEYREHYISGNLLDNDGKSRIIFPIKCSGDLRTGLGDITKAETEEDMIFAMLHNPVLWFKHELGVTLRPYQEDSASCTSRLKVDRWGRRVGKTFHKVGEMLRNMQIGYRDPKTGVTEPMRILVLTPYQSQVDEIFELIDNLIKGSKNLASAVDRRRKNPQELTFSNGARMIGYCTGGDGGASSDKIRGAGGHIIYLDEMDYIPDKHIESVAVIMATTAATQMWTTTTPTGERKKFYYYCFPEGTQITNSNGLTKNIEDVMQGDLVLDAEGGEDVVVETFSRIYDGDIHAFKCKGIVTPPTTSEHPFKIKRNEKVEWIEAKDVVAGDFIYVPNITHSPKTLEYFQPRFTDVENRRIEIAQKKWITKDIAEEYKITKPTVAYIRKRISTFGLLGSFDDRIRKAHVRAMQEIDSINEEVPNGLLRVLGYYLAEGNELKTGRYSSGLQFTFHAKETEYHNEVLLLIKELFGIKGKLVAVKENTTCVFFFSNWLGLLFTHLCGEYAAGKRLHPYLVGINDREWLETYGFGDGHIKDNGAIHYSTISRDLANQTYQAHLRLGDYASIRETSKTRTGNIIYAVDKDSGVRKKGFEIQEKGVWLEVLHTVKEYYEGPVYNFETQKTHTYVAGRVAVHNCTDKRMRYKERHVTAMMSPEWTEETEEVLRLQYSQAGWDHEILAEWGLVEGGVFPTNKINAGIRPYEYGPIEDMSEFKTCIGVDWNGVKAGIPILLIGYSKKQNAYILLDKYISKSAEETQMTGVRDVIAMYDKWNPDYVYLDAGAGATNYELIRSEAKRRGDQKMIDCIKQVHMHSNYEIRDPITKVLVKKQAKALMVDLAVQRAECDMFIFPESENNKSQLLDQIREFVIERYTPTGMPVYSQGNEHQLIAWLLAVFGITIEFSDVAKVNGTGAIGYTPIGIGRSVAAVQQDDYESIYEDLAPTNSRIDVKKVGVNGFNLDREHGSGLARSGDRMQKRTIGGRMIGFRSFGGRSKF